MDNSSSSHNDGPCGNRSLLIAASGSPLAPPTPPPSPHVVEKKPRQSSSGTTEDSRQTELEASGGMSDLVAAASCRRQLDFEDSPSRETPDIIKSAAEALQNQVGSSELNRRDRGFSECSNSGDHDFKKPADASFPSAMPNYVALPDVSLTTPQQQVLALEDVPPSASAFEPAPGQYQLKWTKIKGTKTPIITQNENGPCPLIAIMNVLILKGKVRIPSMIEVITVSQLMEYLGDCILGSVPNNISEGAQLNYEQNMHDAIAMLPKLQTGLDVNVRFTAVGDFEFTPELIVFDLLHIPLYHGWLIDQDALDIVSAVGNCSYNQLVDKIINNKFSDKPELVTEAIIAETFLYKTASQLTYPGLVELTTEVKEDDPSVLFRNNHFITLYRHKNELFQLVTDQGFLTESSVVWETLNNIEGDGQFVDGDFVNVPPKSAAAMSIEDRQSQEDQDYLLALSLQEENKKEAEKFKEWETFKTKEGLDRLTDEELAIKLQAEEDERSPTTPEQTPMKTSSQSGSVDQVAKLDVRNHPAKKTAQSSHQQQQVTNPQPPPRSPTMPYMQGSRQTETRDRRRSDDPSSNRRDGGKKQSCSLM